MEKDTFAIHLRTCMYGSDNFTGLAHTISGLAHIISLDLLGPVDPHCNNRIVTSKTGA